MDKEDQEKLFFSSQNIILAVTQWSWILKESGQKKGVFLNTCYSTLEFASMNCDAVYQFSWLQKHGWTNPWSDEDQCLLAPMAVELAISWETNIFLCAVGWPQWEHIGGLDVLDPEEWLTNWISVSCNEKRSSLLHVLIFENVTSRQAHYIWIS